MSGVCDNKVDGNIEIPSGGTPQDVHVFNMAGPLEKSNDARLQGQAADGGFREQVSRQPRVMGRGLGFEAGPNRGRLR